MSLRRTSWLKHSDVFIVTTRLNGVRNGVFDAGSSEGILSLDLVVFVYFL